MFGKPQISPELLMGLGGGILSGPNLAAGLGQGFQQASNIMTVQRQERELKEGENKTRAFVQQAFPNEDVSNLPGPLLKVYAEAAIKQKFSTPDQPSIVQEYNFAKQQGFTGNFMDYQKSKATLDSKPPAEYQNYQMMQSDPNYAAWVQQQQAAKDTPPIAKEYEWAKQQGFTGSPQEYQAWKANLTKTGMTVEYDPVNGFRMTQGNVDGNKPAKMTEQQSKDINFLTRVKKAESDLQPLERELTSWTQKQMSGLPFDSGNYLKSKEYQQAEQAGREVLAIILRKDTGAAVTQQEFETYGKIYLPQPGDDPATIAAKRASRQAAIQGIQAGLGPLVDQTQPATTTPNSVDSLVEKYRTK